MKKTLLTLFVVTLISCGAYAQYGQGRMLVGGGLDFSTMKNKSKVGGTTRENYTTTSFSLVPRFGYFVIDNLAVGGALNVNTTTKKYEGSDDKETDNELTLSPFVRYYLPQNIFFEGNFGFGTGKNKSEDGAVSVETKYNVTRWALGVGYAAFINDNVAIEPMISYGSHIRTLKDSNPKAKGIDQGLTIGVGFQIYLGK